MFMRVLLIFTVISVMLSSSVSHSFLKIDLVVWCKGLNHDTKCNFDLLEESLEQYALTCVRAESDPLYFVLFQVIHYKSGKWYKEQRREWLFPVEGDGRSGSRIKSMLSTARNMVIVILFCWTPGTRGQTHTHLKVK